jgi:hypothetical protein
MFEEVTTSTIMDAHRHKGEYKEQDRSDFLRSWVHDLKRCHGRVTEVKVLQWLPVEEYEQTYINSDRIDKCVKIQAEIEFKYRQYTGPTEGVVVVHRRIISKELKGTEAWHKEYDIGREFVKTFLPAATYRHCYCCYGNEPDLNYEWTDLPNGDTEIVYTVDFDFDRSEYVDEDDDSPC